MYQLKRLFRVERCGKMIILWWSGEVWGGSVICFKSLSRNVPAGTPVTVIGSLSEIRHGYLRNQEVWGSVFTSHTQRVSGNNREGSGHLVRFRHTESLWLAQSLTLGECYICLLPETKTLSLPSIDGKILLWCYSAWIFSLQIVGDGNTRRFGELLRRFLRFLCAKTIPQSTWLPVWLIHRFNDTVSVTDRWEDNE
jgi:hypothetical protein